MLRKLCASRLSRKNILAEDLMAIMGWSSLEVAKWYLQPAKDEALKKLMED
jgi:hypothetical protein